MKYAVLGAGPIGATLAGALALAGQEVWLIDPQEAVISPIREHGLTLELSPGLGLPGVRRHVALHAAVSPEEAGKVDVVALATKGFHTRSAISSIRALAREDTVVLSVQNGLGNAELLEEQFPGQVAYSVVVMGGRPVSPGLYAATLGDGEIHLPVSTAHSGMAAALKRMCGELGPSPFRAAYLDKREIDKKLWNKLCLNVVVNSINAIHEGPMDALFALPQGVELANLVVDEALAVAQKLGVEICRADVTMVPTDIQPKKDGGYRHYPSMCMDVIHRRRLEDEFLNGAIVREGKRVGVPTPYNQALSLLMQIIEQTYGDRYSI